MAARRRFTRPPGKRRYRRLFIIATEGAKTELCYFRWFSDEHIHIVCPRVNHRSAPSQILRRLNRTLEEYELKDTDEAWIVVDKDQWSDAQLKELYEWSREQTNYHLAVSNPQFEFWLLLHFENGARVTGSSACLRRLKNHWPDYNENRPDMSRLTAGIADAVRRGKQKDTPPCTDWPRNTGSTVYRLVEKLVP